MRLMGPRRDAERGVGVRVSPRSTGACLGGFEIEPGLPSEGLREGEEGPGVKSIDQSARGSGGAEGLGGAPGSEGRLKRLTSPANKPIASANGLVPGGIAPGMPPGPGTCGWG
jgi:hypothetical protein